MKTLEIFDKVSEDCIQEVNKILKIYPEIKDNKEKQIFLEDLMALSKIIDICNKREDKS